jgi:hypothetical protein
MSGEEPRRAAVADSDHTEAVVLDLEVPIIPSKGNLVDLTI